MVRKKLKEEKKKRKKKKKKSGDTSNKTGSDVARERSVYDLC